MARSDLKMDMTNLTPYDFAGYTYWVSRVGTGTFPDYTALVDVHNPAEGEDVRINQFMPTFPSFDFKSKRTRLEMNGGQLIDLSTMRDTIRVTRIREIGRSPRDYVLDLDVPGNDRIYQYVVQNCNHEMHAYNRFKKRVREQINFRLSVDFTVEMVEGAISVPTQDGTDRSVSIEGAATMFYEWPAKHNDLTYNQWKKVAEWVRENLDRSFGYTCSCAICEASYKDFITAQKQQEEAEKKNTMKNNRPYYDLTLVIEDKEIDISGDEDVLELIKRASEARTALIELNPYITFEVRRDGRELVAEIGENGVVIR